jgi:hypothetical protein
MDSIISALLKNGAFGIMAAVFIYLLVKLWKDYRQTTREYVQHQIEDTAAMHKLTSALENVADTVDALEARSLDEFSSCRSHVQGMTTKLDDYITAERLERAKEEGRREATNPRFKLPTGENDGS